MAANLRFREDWQAGTYAYGDAVSHNGLLWAALKTTSQEPAAAASDWAQLAMNVEGVEDGDVIIYWQGSWVAATLLEGYFGIIGMNADQAVGASPAAWTEFNPASFVSGDSQNIAYLIASGRFRIDYSGAPEVPTGPLKGVVICTFSAEFPNANTDVEVSLARNGVPISEADGINTLVSNAGNQTTGTVAAGTLYLPGNDFVDQEELSIVVRNNNAFTMRRFVFEIAGDPIAEYQQRSS